MTTVRWDGLIWDVDGTIALTEREGHLPACNAAFAAMDLPIRWSWEEFQGLLGVPGNELRMKRALEALDHPPDHPEEVAGQLARLKKKLYLERFLSCTSLRPGIRDLIREARERGLRQAIVTTSDEEQIHALLSLHLPEEKGWFSPVFGKRAGRKTAPDSPLYRRCLAEWGCAGNRVLAIEDSEVGLRAACEAGIPTVVTYNDYTSGHDFRGASWVTSSLARVSLDRLAQEVPEA
ncbi:HAD hydrolase-like protein [Methylacidimicrobium tartarophylax]|uniref:Beta-phosphoglucomutase n=1 Tax=Methylacidimicrobium tartarophylax TaxID=1041768 RepID=A0A5E6MD99_9BACT|nr:HAD hydrolase-like protein [Methylacidimicrobium tartarophylax]VVM07518.1 Beta-phosphoglucomutase [Methylacidimicrobium tartarophylax]